MNQHRYTYITAVIFTISIIGVYMILDISIQTNQETNILLYDELSSKIQEQQELIQSHADTILGLNNTLTECLNEIAELAARITYLESRIAVMDSEPVFMPLYFTSFNQDNLNNTLQVTQTKASWSHADRKVQFSLIYPVDTPITNFIHRISFCFTQVEAGDENQRGIGGVWMVTNEENLPKLNALSVWGEQVGDQDGVYYLYFAQKTNDSLDFIRLLGVYEEGVEYHLEISRKGSESRLIMYEDPAYTQELTDTGYVEGVATPYNYIGVTGHPMRTVDVDDWTSGYVENLIIAEQPTP